MSYLTSEEREAQAAEQAQRELRGPRRSHCRLRTAALAALVLTAGVLGGMAIGQANGATAAPADVTIAPCSAGANAHFDGPVLPDVCITKTGQISVPNSTDTLLPHCISDDYNDGSQDLCWTQRVTDHAVLVIDSTDTVVSQHAE